MYSPRIPLRLRRLCPPSQVHPNPARNILPSRRRVHTLPELPYNIEDGLGEFLSPAALRMIAVDYQQGLLTRLNEQVKGTEMENQSVVQTVISAAGHRRHALAFNYASQALNNNFFLQYLKPLPPGMDSHEEFMGRFKEEILLNFGSVGQFKSTFSAAAMGMVNSGWVWLVSDEQGHLQVMGTFGAGTLLVRSRRHTLEDENKPILGEAQVSIRKAPFAKSSPQEQTTSTSHRSSSSGLQTPSQRMSHPPSSRAMHASPFAAQFNFDKRPNPYAESPISPAMGRSARSHLDQSGDILTPLLCISVHEHAWIGAGYGIWGKEEYLKRFWSVVNWQAVAQAFMKAIRYR